MADYIDASGRVVAWPLQGRTDDQGQEQSGEHFDGRDAGVLLVPFASGVADADAFRVAETSPPSMAVRVGSGTVGDEAIVRGTDTLQPVYGVRWTDATTVVPINAADVSNPRYTSIFLVVADNQFDQGGLVLPRLATVDGTPSSNPQVPDYNGPETAVLRLANVLVAQGATEIEDEDIEDARPFVGVRIAAASRLTVDRAHPPTTQVRAPVDGAIDFYQGDTRRMRVVSTGLNMQGNAITNLAAITSSPGAIGSGVIAPGAIADFVTTGFASSTTYRDLTNQFVDQVGVTFNKPSGWNNYSMVAWGGIVAATNSPGGTLLEARAEIGGVNGAVMQVPHPGIQDVPADLPLTTSAAHRVSSTSASNITIALAARRFAGAPLTHRGSWIAYMAIRLT